jgi:hypothetical protein
MPRMCLTHAGCAGDYAPDRNTQLCEKLRGHREHDGCCRCRIRAVARLGVGIRHFEQLGWRKVGGQLVSPAGVYTVQNVDSGQPGGPGPWRHGLHGGGPSRAALPRCSPVMSVRGRERDPTTRRPDLPVRGQMSCGPRCALPIRSDGNCPSPAAHPADKSLHRR